MRGGFLPVHVVAKSLRDGELLRVARGAPTFKRASLLKHGEASTYTGPKRPIPITFAADPMPPPLQIDATDACIRRHAQRLAAYACAPVPGAADDMECLAHLYRVCRLQHVEPPELKPEMPAAPVIARLADPKWWRGRLRSSVARRTERDRIRSGVVHRGAQVYCSDAGVHRRRESAKRNHDLMQMIDLLNESTGEMVCLADLVAASTSNPVLRRNELMTRCRGLEETADERGDRGLFVTWTLPSRFHPVLKSGHRNPKWDGSDPGAGASFFALQWARVRAALAKAVIPANKRYPEELRGLTLYGIRVAEPHHDETPHWHLLLFAPLRWHRMVCATIAQYAFVEGDEPGAEDARLICKLIQKGIDPKTGKARSAVGYVAKYLAKNIDGFQLEFTMERGADGDLHFTGDGATAAERIRAWASCWGIKQFQFFGTPPVTIYRELRRLDGPVPLLTAEAARVAADAGDYAAHVKAVGGVTTPRRLLDLATHRAAPLDDAGEPRMNRYGEAAPAVIKGVAEVLARVLGKKRNALLMAEPLITRIHSWTPLEPREAGPLAPRTRVNNCNRSETDGTRNDSAADLDRSRKPAFLTAGSAAGILAGLGWRADLAGSIADDLECLADVDQDGQEGMDAGPAYG